MDMSMLPLLLMMGQGKGEDSKEDSGSNPAQMEMLMRMMGLDQETVVEAVWEDAVVFGTAKDRSNEQTIGVLEVRVTPPVVNDPVARIRVKTNGIILSRPEHLRKVGEGFLRMSKDEAMLKAFEEAKTEEETVAKEAEMSKVAKGLLG